jgi:hypothetical protein
MSDNLLYISPAISKKVYNGGNNKSGGGPMDPVTRFEFELYKKDVDSHFKNIDSQFEKLSLKIDTEIAKSSEKQTKWLIGALFVLAGIIIAALKWFI